MLLSPSIYISVFRIARGSDCKKAVGVFKAIMAGLTRKLFLGLSANGSTAETRRNSNEPTVYVSRSLTEK